MPVCPQCGDSASGADSYCHHDGARLMGDDPSDPLLGQLVGSYRIAGVLGQGGMGRVYLAVHPSIGSRVAVKVLSHDCAHRPHAVQRFFDEARLVNRIRHDGIVQVLDLATLPDGRPYIVMELLSGRTLTAVLDRSGPMVPSHALQLCTRLLDALDAAHRCGVIHRDLKPDNVFVTDQGRVVILDFGIAKLVPESDGQAVPTTTRSLIGTPAFMAPEQIQGKPASPATDVYAVGLIVYRMLTGQPAFHGESVYELLRAQVSQQPPLMRNTRPDVPDALDAVVQRALAKDPDQRFASAAQLRLALAHAAREPGPARVPPRRSRAGLAVGIASLALVAAVVAIVVLAAGSAEQALSSPVDDAAPVETAAVERDAALPADASIAIASAQPAEPRKTARPKAARPRQPRKPGEQAVTSFGGVTIVSTSKLAEQMTGLEPVFVPMKLGTDFDAVRFLPRARVLAQQLMPDARLTLLEIDHLRWDGVTLLRKDSGATYRFRSQKRSARPAGVMANEEVDIPCMVYVEVTQAGVRAGPVTHEQCNQTFLTDPTCEGVHLWRRAFPKGPPPGAKDYAAEADFDGTWWLSIDGLTVDGEEGFSTDFTDNCR